MFPPSPRSAYIHVPFCRHRCGYCNFTVLAGRDDLVGAYLNAMACELSWLGTPREADTLFLGGGTPTHLSPAELDRLLAIVLRWHPLAKGHEFTIEANPSDLTRDTVAVLRDFGVNRLSLGAQSFLPEKLRALERDHSAQDIRRSVDLARAAGLNVAVDLIFAAPGETLDHWKSDLHQAVSQSPDHISTYGLTFEKGTHFWNRRHSGELAAAGEELERSMFEVAIEFLTQAGFDHYEVSNFALPDKRCRHNEAYWLGHEYYAAGAGAARYVGGVRSMNHRSTTTYIKRVMAGESPVFESEQLSERERALELLVFALRRCEGIQRTWFEQKTHFQLDALVGSALGEFVEHDLMLDQNGRVQLTRKGLMVSDTLFNRLLTRGPSDGGLAARRRSA